MSDYEDLIKASNWYQTRVHYTLKMTPYRGRTGFRGTALCSTDSSEVAVWDQSHHDAMYQQGRGKKPKDLDKLPLCKKCARKTAKLTPAQSR